MSSLKKKIFKKQNIFQNLITIFGLGKATALKCCEFVGIQPFMKYNNLRDDQISYLLSYIEQNYINIESNLKLLKKDNKNFMEKVKNIRFLRNKFGLPSRGQRTHTNASTKKILKNS